jgi:hypothetical protein
VFGQLTLPQRPYMRFLSVGPKICRQLPSDSTSRWTPLLLANACCYQGAFGTCTLELLPMPGTHEKWPCFHRAISHKGILVDYRDAIIWQSLLVLQSFLRQYERLQSTRRSVVLTNPLRDCLSHSHQLKRKLALQGC